MPVTSRVSFTPLVVTEFSVQQDWARTYAGTHTTTEQRRQRLLSFQHFLQNLDLGTKPKKTVQPFEPRAPKICHISTVNSTSSNCMEHACRLVIKKITGCTVHCTASLTVQRWPTLSGKLPSLPPLQCTAYFTARCTIHPNVHSYLQYTVHFSVNYKENRHLICWVK